MESSFNIGADEWYRYNPPTMIEWLQTLAEWFRNLSPMAALPNLHAAVVHIPVALLPTALLLDFAALVFRRRVWLERAAALLYVLGTVGAGAAYLTGERASEEMWKFSGAAQTAMADHEKLGLLTLTVFTAITLLRLMASWLARHDRSVPLGMFRLLAVFAATAGMLLLFLTADHGGSLVYRHGMGVESSQSEVSNNPE